MVGSGPGSGLGCAPPRGPAGCAPPTSQGSSPSELLRFSYSNTLTGRALGVDRALGGTVLVTMLKSASWVARGLTPLVCTPACVCAGRVGVGRGKCVQRLRLAAWVVLRPLRRACLRSAATHHHDHFTAAATTATTVATPTSRQWLFLQAPRAIHGIKAAVEWQHHLVDQLIAAAHKAQDVGAREALRGVRVQGVAHASGCTKQVRCLRSARFSLLHYLLQTVLPRCPTRTCMAASLT